MPPIKLDFALEGVDVHRDVAAAAKAGTPVKFAPGETDTELFVIDQTGAKLGRVPALLQQALLADSFTATVRSCRRHEGKISELTVRAIANGEQQAPAQLPGPAQTAGATDSQTDILEGTTQLPQSHLELLAANESVRNLLKDERLQQQILSIDKSADREKALQLAFQNADFKIFADTVLGVTAIG